MGERVLRRVVRFPRQTFGGGDEARAPAVLCVQAGTFCLEQCFAPPCQSPAAGPATLLEAAHIAVDRFRRGNARAVVQGGLATWLLCLNRFVTQIYSLLHLRLCTP